MKKLENYLDKEFKDLQIDVDILGKHFLDRINDPRNKTPITVDEIKSLFLKLKRKFFVSDCARIPVNSEKFYPF